ncbi:MAG TPA: polysaccharide biosynthesis protein [Candidatus Saccharimonadales bacterium]|nr:polysaccharide biosynthesis protein [Candidatus Saccharimonadales bacterium]
MKTRSTRKPEGRDNDAPDFSGASLSMYTGKRILITGAGGSIGSQLVKQLIHLAPEKIAALDRDVNALSELEQDVNLRRSSIYLQSFVADVRDAGRLSSICQSFCPQVIFHAAAYDHVSLPEMHPCEAILGNVLGTENLLNIAAGFGVERLIFISSVNAVNPVSVSGATKRIGEMLFHSAAKVGRIRTASVRLGSVLGSRCCVIPLFQRQILHGGPVTITHPDIARYFISMRRAIQLILCAGGEAKEGEIYIPEMGKPRKIQELAKDLILLSNADFEKEITIQITGLRPGEKLVQEVSSKSEKLESARFGGLFTVHPSAVNERTFRASVSQLIQSARCSDNDSIYRILASMALGFTHVPQRRSIDLESLHSRAETESSHEDRSSISAELSRAVAAGTSGSPL